jgi:hypothetical protein
MIPPLLAAAADPVGAGVFLGWGPVTISLGNAIVIVAMDAGRRGALLYLDRSRTGMDAAAPPP